ncbi:Neuropeptide FF receptor 2 [Halotydeus destructor]|nr:Neuropeptide FF receptor 2 [Halotydeus destructor]
MSSDYQDPCELSKALEHLAPNATSLLANWTPVNCPEEDDYYPDLSQIAVIRISLIILYLTNMALALLGNAAVCWTVLSNRKMQTVVNYYIVNLAACDFMVGAFVLPVKLLELTAPAHWNVLNDGLCTSALYSQTVCVFASILTLVATCLERYANVQSSVSCSFPFSSNMILMYTEHRVTNGSTLFSAF